MMAVPLEELLVDREVSYGIVQPGSDLSEGTPILRVKDIRNGLIDPSCPMRVDPAIAARFKRTCLRGGEVLLTLVGTVGEAAVVPEELAGWNVARAIAVLRGAEVESDWLSLCFRTASVRSQIDAALNTTVQATLNLADLKRIQIPMPERSERRAIAEVLGALDDKIAANGNVVRAADDLAETTFRAAAREGDAIPLSSLARFVNGKAFTKGATGTGRVVIRIAELNNGLGGSTVRNDIDVADDHVARPGDLLFAWSGSLTVARWFRDEAIVNQHIFKVIPDGHPLWFVNQAVRSKLRDYQAIAADKATTMGHIQRKHLDEAVTVPNRGATARLDACMSGLWQRALAAEIENETLAATRDGLLPLLMSGKLRVKDAEKQVGEVV